MSKGEIMVRLADIKALVFDAYGTLFDVHSAVGRHREGIGPVADELSALWRAKQLEYTWLRSLMGVHADFWQVTQDALDYAMDACAIDDPQLRADLMNAYLDLDTYPEVRQTLAMLKDKGLKNAILSNGSPAMLEAAVSAADIREHLDGVFSVEEVGVYKPDPRVYRLACDRLQLEPREIIFFSSNAWDAAGAANFGVRVVWVNRFRQRRERLPKTPDVELPTLAALPDLLG